MMKIVIALVLCYHLTACAATACNILNPIQCNAGEACVLDLLLLPSPMPFSCQGPTACPLGGCALSTTCVYGFCATACDNSVCGASGDASLQFALYAGGVKLDKVTGLSVDATFNGAVATDVVATASAAMATAANVSLGVSATAQSSAALTIQAGVNFVAQTTKFLAANSALIIRGATAATYKSEELLTQSNVNAAVTFSSEIGSGSSSCTFNKVTLSPSASLTVQGKGKVQLGNAAGQVSAASSNTIALGGGVWAAGWTSKATVTIGGGDSHSSNIVVVGPVDTLYIGENGQGQMAGTTDQRGSSTLKVNGEVVLQGADSNNVKFYVQGAQGAKGRLNIAVQQFVQKGTTATIEAREGAEVLIQQAGAAVRFAKWSFCDAASTITIKTAAFSSLKIGESAVAFSYDSLVKSELNCNVRLWDGSAYATLSQGVSGRRLLASSGTYTWDNNQMKYTYNAASSLHGSIVSVVAAGIACLLLSMLQ
jgi:hypothetical protein